MIDLIKQESKKIREWVIKANGNDCDLRNWCTICSYLIFKRLKARGLDPIFCSVVQYGSGVKAHCFVFCNEHIIDVTADQFGIKKDIVVRHNPNRKHRFWFWNFQDALEFKDIVDIEKHLDLWEDCCNPKKKFRQKCA